MYNNVMINFVVIFNLFALNFGKVNLLYVLSCLRLELFHLHIMFDDFT